VRDLPLDDPGLPDTRSPVRFLLWIALNQWLTLVAGIAFGICWLVAQAVMPWAIGRGIEDGVVDGDVGASLRWALVVLGLGIVQSAAGVIRHRLAVSNWLQSMFRTVQVVVRHTARTGPAITRNVTTGEVVSTVASDADHIGAFFFDILQRFVGAVVAYAVVAVVVLRTSVPLGLLVLVGVPVLVVCLAPILRPLQARQRAQRDAAGRLTALGTDTVAGLRVLRSIGGEQVFLGRYQRQSQEVRATGIRVAGLQATLDAAQVLFPGIFVVVLTWLGARFVLTGRIDAGDLVAFYGYAFFLVIPLRSATLTAERGTRALVGARRILDVLGVSRDVTDAGRSPAVLSAGGTLADASSGLVVRPGLFTAVVSADPAESAALADRLGRFVDDNDVTLDGVRLVDLPLAEVRRRIVVSETEPRLFTGTLRAGLDPFGRHGDGTLLQAVHTASATDVLDALPEGLDGHVEERGRAFSGGQRQRITLARALVRDPEILILVEPTSAVDAHTEARVAERLRRARTSRTTIATTTSPLVLDQADVVAWFEQGRLAAEGTHRLLLAEVPGYRDAVTREERS
jgi:ABC-type multidrug transport system fused ATPase/permease subunit